MKKCIGCDRTLSGYRSQTRGFGPECWIRMVSAFEQALEHHAKERVHAAVKAIENGQFARSKTTAAGFDVRSGSGLATYSTTAKSCTCEAGRHDRATCYHRIGAQILANVQRGA